MQLPLASQIRRVRIRAIVTVGAAALGGVRAF